MTRLGISTVISYSGAASLDSAALPFIPFVSLWPSAQCYPEWRPDTNGHPYQLFVSSDAPLGSTLRLARAEPTLTTRISRSQPRCGYGVRRRARSSRKTTLSSWLATQIEPNATIGGPRAEAPSRIGVDTSFVTGSIRAIVPS